MTLTEWATRWGIPPQALAELVTVNTGVPAPLSRPIESESALQSLIRLEAAQKGVRLWRNNVGVLKDKEGRPIRYGLANDSKKLNELVKSGDLIGWRPRVIGVDDVGKVIAQFVSRECKAPGWRLNPNDDRESAQVRWASMINKDGGDAAIITAEGSL